jgi:DNA polymerase I-like protein with 3'-5' exonuclease and polymerase domains
VGESPFLSGFTEQENHSGWTFDIERTIFVAMQNAATRFDKLEGRFTYAVRCQVEKPNAKEMVACAPNLRAELLEYATPEKPICIFVMGATALKSLGVQFKKYTDVISKVIEMNVEGRRAYIFVSLSKRQLATKAGYTEILARQIEVFLKLVQDNKVGELEAKRSVLSRLSEEYQYPRTVEELSKLVTEIVNYSIPGIAREHSPISLDTETNTLYPHRDKLQLLMVSVCWDKGKSAAIQLEHPESSIDLEDARPHLERLLTCVKPKIFANAKYDLKVFECKGFKVANLSWDVMLGEHLIEEDKKGFYGLKHITRLRLPEFSAYEDELKEIYAGRLDTDALTPADTSEASQEEQLLKKVKPKRTKKKKADDAPKQSRLEKKLETDDGYKNIPLQELMKYAAFDADVTLRCSAQQRTELTEESKSLAKKRSAFLLGTKEVSKRIGEVLFKHPNPPLYNMAKRILPTTKILAKMELHGMAVDREYIFKLQADMDSYLASSSTIFTDMLPIGLTEFNPASTQHVAKALFSTGYLQPGTGELICYAGKIEPPRTEKGAISTDAKFLKFLTNTHKCALSEAILEFRGISKARTTFIENIEVLSREDGRMHSNFHQHGTATARLCVGKNTLLETTVGVTPISELDLKRRHKDARIRTHRNRYKRILGCYYKGKEEMFRVTASSGNTLDVTKEHRFYAPTTPGTPFSFIPLSQLSVGHPVVIEYVREGKIKITSCNIESIQSIGEQEVWDIQVETDHSYIAHGFVNHNSSSEENLQNLPKRIGRPPHQYHIKRIFIPTHPDFVIINADAKAAEVRVYAAYSRDKALIQALNDGMDPHSFFASTVYKVENVLQDIKPSQYASVLTAIGIDQNHAWSYEDFEARDTLKKMDKAYGEQLDALRKNIKRVVFGILYGAAPKKIAGIVGIPENQAEAIIRTLFNMFPSIKDYIDITERQVQQIGVVETFLGRRRHLNLQNLPQFLRGRAKRQAVNFKIQNTSAEMVLDVFCTTDPVIENDFGGNMLNTVHDSLVFQIPKKYVHQMPAFIQDYGVKQVAKKYPWLPVPFSWDVEVGANYGDLMSVASFLSSNPEFASGEEDDYMDLEIRNALAEEATAEHAA